MASATHRSHVRPVGLLVVAVTVLVAVAATAPPVSADDGSVEYSPPVDAPVVDPFRPPEHAYGPGNRGIKYATEPGQAIRAVAPGEVTFAGQVGGALHVTVLHPDGLRSTVSYVASISVDRGDDVQRGDEIARSGPLTHLGVRAGDEYLDPAALFTNVAGRARLIPDDEAASSAAEERAAIQRWLATDRLSFGQVAAGWLRGQLGRGFEIGKEIGKDLAEMAVVLDPTYMAVSTGIELYQRLEERSPCTPGTIEAPAPAERRIVVLVGGLGSSSNNAAVDDVDVEALGYDKGDIYRFSYRGGRVEDPGDAAQSIEATTYDAADSQVDIEDEGALLSELLSELAILEPGVPIDVIAHSQGGLVTRTSLFHLEERGSLDDLGAVVTLGTPHSGADLATAAAAIRLDTASTGAFTAVDAALGTGIDIGSPSMRQLAVGSGLVDELASRGIPDGVSLTSVAARGDLVVPSKRSRVDGAGNTVVALGGLSAHDRLPGSPLATREIGLALAGLPPTCESTSDVVRDTLTGAAIAHVEEVVGVGVLATALAVPG